MLLVILASWVHNVLVHTESKMLCFYFFKPQIGLKTQITFRKPYVFIFIVLSSNSSAVEVFKSPNLIYGKDKSKSPSARGAK